MSDNYLKFNSGHNDRANQRDPYDDKSKRSSNGNSSQSQAVVRDVSDKVAKTIRK